jgi:hypothetical protein
MKEKTKDDEYRKRKLKRYKLERQTRQNLEKDTVMKMGDRSYCVK